MWSVSSPSRNAFDDGAEARVALSEARRKWVEDHVATAVGRSEQQFESLALETAARRRKQVIDEPAYQGSEAGKDDRSLSGE